MATHWKGERRNVLVLHTDTVNDKPSTQELDTDVVARWLHTKLIDCNQPITPVCIGCGCCVHETKILRKLIELGHTLHNEIFMDRFVTSATLETVRVYGDGHDRRWVRRPRIVFSFSDLQSEMEYDLSVSQDTVFLVFGVHASQMFNTVQELYKFHEWLCFCARLSAVGKANKEYYNFVARREHIASSDPTVIEQCEVGQVACVYHRDWWDFACTMLTCKASAQLLVPTEEIVRGSNQ